jgi:hypothetical protein
VIDIDKAPQLTVCLRQVPDAVQAVVATHVECGLAREFGVAWVPRVDGRGNEIAGVTQEQMDAYSSRTMAITDRLPGAVESWTAKYGREPNKRELLHIRQEVTMASRDGKKDGELHLDARAGFLKQPLWCCPCGHGRWSRRRRSRCCKSWLMRR